jgi:DNA-binding NarL/FixJ family response regulator
MKKILVVDDDNILRRLLKHYLEKQGYQVIDAASGEEGLKVFNEHHPALVVSDVSMPMMNGLEFCRQLRSEVEGQLVPFIFLSAKDDLDDKIKGHSMGADDYITKPFDMKELLAKIEALLQRSQRIHAEIIRLIQKLPQNRVTQESQSSSLTTHPSATKPRPLPLTPAEEKVFWEVIQGFSNREIGEHLFISHRTVQTHLSSILSKLNLDNRAQLVKFAYEQGYNKVKQHE